MDGQVLSFRLAGINNQNFIMEDRETGSWWQQVTGRAIAGPLQGRPLTAVYVLKDYWAIYVLKDYWFDWTTYHPETAVYGLGTPHSF